MIRIDAVWLAVEPQDMRAGVDRLLAHVVQVFGSAHAHHGYLFANARGTRVKQALSVSAVVKEPATSPLTSDVISRIDPYWLAHLPMKFIHISRKRTLASRRDTTRDRAKP